ncbi:NAD(P)H-binding protein [Streptomyces sp. NPDC004609]|uniref:NAD(P)H-binding protein n=1 Tax=Streptomyces sp. NPDC004609 TaxID=3364704 RepID=UPI0036C19204
MTPSDSSTQLPVLVLGGTGKTGRRVAERLRRRGVPVRAASRSGAVRFDWSDEKTWGPALTGVHAVYIVDSQGPRVADELTAFAAAAVAHGVRRLVLLASRAYAELDDGSGTLLAPERAVRESGLEWTILRPTWFAENFTELAEFSALFTEGELRLPTGEGREPFVSLDDLADVAVAALTEDGHAGQIYPLSGPRALTMREAVAAISSATGRPLRYTPLTDDQYREELAAAGYPPEYTDLFIGLFRHIRESGSAELSDGVRRALGREPQDFSEYTRRTDFPE